MTYAMLAPDCFTDEHKSFLAGFRQSMEMLSSSSNMMLGAKDIRSRHLAATDAYARIVALERAATSPAGWTAKCRARAPPSSPTAT